MKFNTIPDPPMSNVPPASDAIVAMKLATIREQGELWGRYTPETERLMRQMMAKHDDEQRAFDNWIAAGRPDLP